MLSSLKTLTLLCVEDNHTTQILYESLLEDMFANIIFAYDGEEGYSKYMAGGIDIIMTDYDMPVLNGLDMIKKVRDTGNKIPVIFVSAIEDINVFVEALNLDVNSFVRKPMQNEELFKALENSSKILLAEEYLKKQKENEVYRKYQEDLGFEKELNILRNDFYYQMIESQGIHLVDFSYMPLDVLSGDAYSARRIDEHETFYLMIDGMGKGLSASLTAMTMATFVNHIVDKMILLDSFDLSVLIHETMEYIKPILLDEESLSLDYILIDDKEKMLYYSKFAMPVLLMENKDSQIQRIKSNNAALSKWQDTFKIDSFDISEIKKFLIYSDGVAENETIYDAKPYADFIEEDFLNSFTKGDLKNNLSQKITKQEDDITLIYIHNLNVESMKTITQTFQSSLQGVENATIWYEEFWQSITDDMKISYSAGLAFTELFMNAYEHGNLDISSEQKHKALEEDIYFEMLAEKERDCSKEIGVRVCTIKHSDARYIITNITDEGKGFDTQMLSDIFRNSKMFNGRGVFVSRKNSEGIYYNSKGNSVLYIHKVEEV